MSKINLKKIAFVFPGQGSQHIGMGEDICRAEQNAKSTFFKVAEACDFDLARVAWVGPEEALRRTCYTQPALLATSAACLQALRLNWTENPFCVAGHSLGEISALWAAEALNLKQAAEITVLRGQLMENAPAGSMAAILGMEADKLKEICQEFDIVVANFNTPLQQVISGSSENIEKIKVKLTELKAKVISLPVGGAFHSSLMNSANEIFSQKLETVEFKDSICPVIQNINAKPYTLANELKQNLQKQMTASVYWTDTISKMLEMGTEGFIEIGAGKVLSGLIKKIDRNALIMQVSDSESLKQSLELLV